MSGQHYASRVDDLVKSYKAQSILDYGCGKRTLEAALRQKWFGTPLAEIVNYDPAVEGCEHTRKPCDFVVCTDVLEHIEPEFLDNVLDDIDANMRVAGLLTVALIPAKKHLADGRNAHLIVRPYTWWLQKLWGRFSIMSFHIEVGLEREFVEMVCGVEPKR